jgi:hypothetical protein
LRRRDEPRERADAGSTRRGAGPNPSGRTAEPNFQGTCQTSRDARGLLAHTKRQVPLSNRPPTTHARTLLEKQKLARTAAATGYIPPPPSSTLEPTAARSRESHIIHSCKQRERVNGNFAIDGRGGTRQAQKQALRSWTPNVSRTRHGYPAHKDETPLTSGISLHGRRPTTTHRRQKVPRTAREATNYQLQLLARPV